jgi:hypothetical protein
MTLNLCSGVYIIDQGSVDLHSGTINTPPSSGCPTTGGVTIILKRHGRRGAGYYHQEAGSSCSAGNSPAI